MGGANMHTLAKLMIALFLPLAALGGQAQAQTYSTTVAAEFSRAELDQMLAPIALYPDTVLSHVLIAATYPLEVVQADRWAQNNSHLEAEAAVDAVEHKDWDPSVRALVAFPQILQRMSEDLDWTQRLGDAFLLNEAQVMNVIQDLRQKAYAAGSLQKMKHVTVQRERKIIVIEPAVERVVYIPYYDTRVVYGNWWWHDYPPTYWRHPHDHHYVGGFYWGPRAYLGVSFFSTSFHWHQHRVVYIDHHHYHGRHVRRPYTSRKIARHEGARHWQHNPEHRRGVAYRNERMREQYGSHRTSIEKLQDQRNTSHRFTDSNRSVRHSSSASTRRDQQHERHWAREQNPDNRAAIVRERLSKTDAEPARRWRNDDKANSEHSDKRFRRSEAVAERLDKARAPAEARHSVSNDHSRLSQREHGSAPTPGSEPEARQRSAILEARREQLSQQSSQPSNTVQEKRQAPARGQAKEERLQRREALRQRQAQPDSSNRRSDQPRMHKTQRETGGGHPRTSDRAQRQWQRP